MKMTGAQGVIECLKAEGVDTIFGYPGGAVLPLYDAIYDSGIKHVLPRHEQGAVHAADGFARASGKAGVCIATSGPGATNLITGIATAYMDSVPLVCITGQVGSSLLGRDSFQEADIVGISTPITKHNFLVTNPKDLVSVFKKAFYIATTGRPGPVVIDITKDSFTGTMDFDYSEKVELRGYKPVFEGVISDVEKASALIREAKRPLLFVGGGANQARITDELMTLVKRTDIPVVSTLMGLGAFPLADEKHLGMVGMHGTYAANKAVTDCDLLIAVGVRFSDRVTGMVEKFAADAKIIQFDIDKAEFNKNIKVAVKVAGHLKWSFNALLQDVGTQKIAEWNQQLLAWQEQGPLSYKEEKDIIKPQEVISKLSVLTKGEAIVATDVGQHQMWTAQFYEFQQANSIITSGGLGTMGFGLPAAIGAQISKPEREVWAIVGDGGFMMNCQEIPTAVEWDLPLKVIIINNSGLGMVRQWQRMFYDKRYAHTKHGARPDFVELAKVMGADGITVKDPGQLESALKKAKASQGPFFLDVWVAQEEDVLPMVAPGAPLDKMIGGKK